jgi:hypothetical protein
MGLPYSLMMLVHQLNMFVYLLVLAVKHVALAATGLCDGWFVCTLCKQPGCSLCHAMLNSAMVCRWDMSRHARVNGL